MSNNYNQENNRQEYTISANVTSEKKCLTFKDWKSLKDSRSRTNVKMQNRTKQFLNEDSRNSFNNNNSFNGSKSSFVSWDSNNFYRNNGKYSVPPSSNCNGMSNFNMPESYCGPKSNFFYNSSNAFHNDFSGPNSYYRLNNRFKHFNAPNNFTSSKNLQNTFGNDRFICNSSKDTSFKLLGNFFVSDSIFPQSNTMQKPLPNINPFRNDQKSSQLLEQFDKSLSTKDDKKKKKCNMKTTEVKKLCCSNNEPKTIFNNKEKPLKDPEVYIPNPKAKYDGKLYIQKPKIPQQNLEITKEEKKQQWKDYRQAMKPFKNRDFYNAKRVEQRLGKKAPSELNEKELIRLTNAREIMAAHKARLCAKYANYVKAEDSRELGELYVLKKIPLNQSNIASKSWNKQLQHFGNLDKNQPIIDFESGRKIIGGYTGFIAESVSDVTPQDLKTQ